MEPILERRTNRSRRRYMQDPTRPTAWENTQGNKFTANGEWAYAGNTDWMDIFYKNAAFMQQHNAS